MLTLAAIPSASVGLVVARSATLGLRNGIAVAIGIVLGDLLFVGIALVGMSVLATTIGTLFSLFKYLGGAYLIWLGLRLLRSNEPTRYSHPDTRRSTWLASLAAGFLLTLGDWKAILFYASLFPTLVDVAHLSLFDLLVIVSVTILTVGGTKLGYAVGARAIVNRLQSRFANRCAKKVGGCMMLGTGAYLITKT